MTDDTIHFEALVTSPVLSAQEARILLDHLDHVQAASLLGDRWTVWCAAKKRLICIVSDGEKRDEGSGA